MLMTPKINWSLPKWGFQGYKNHAQTIERELKQAGIEFNVKYGSAWHGSLKSRSLLSAWGSFELCGNQNLGMATEEEVLTCRYAKVDAGSCSYRKKRH